MVRRPLVLQTDYQLARGPDFATCRDGCEGGGWGDLGD